MLADITDESLSVPVLFQLGDVIIVITLFQEDNIFARMSHAFDNY